MLLGIKTVQKNKERGCWAKKVKSESRSESESETGCRRRRRRRRKVYSKLTQ